MARSIWRLPSHAASSGSKKVGFGIEVVAECVVGVGDGFLDGAVGQDDLEDQGVDAV